MDEFDIELSKQLDLSLKQIENKCREILQDYIESELYDKYEPKIYHRTYQLLNSVRTEIRDDLLYVYINTGDMHYKANSPQGMDVTKQVPYYVNYGHNNEDSPYPFMYNSYPSRNFIEKAKDRIEKELGLEVEIMNSFEEI